MYFSAEDSIADASPPRWDQGGTCHVPRRIRMYVLQAQARSREKSEEVTKGERKPPIEKRGISTSHTAGYCTMRDVTKKYNIKRTRHQG